VPKGAEHVQKQPLPQQLPTPVATAATAPGILLEKQQQGPGAVTLEPGVAAKLSANEVPSAHSPCDSKAAASTATGASGFSAPALAQQLALAQATLLRVGGPSLQGE
jgi:hypothetical protein